jgi:hypothetical protein
MKPAPGVMRLTEFQGLGRREVRSNLSPGSWLYTRRDSNGQSNSEGNPGSYSTHNREGNGQSCEESNEDSDSDRNGQGGL